MQNNFQPSIHPVVTVGTFRITGKQLFLTYPQYSIIKEDLRDFINSKYQTSEIIVATEHHQDGHEHMHVYAKFERRIDIRNPRIFDHDGHHCNIQAVRNTNACKTYTMKDNNFITSIIPQGIQTPGIENIYDLARNTLEEENFFEECRTNKINYMYARHAWLLVQTARDDFDTIPEDAVIGGEISSPTLVLLRPMPGSKPIWILGPTGVGKTTWAKKYAERPSLFVSQMDTLQLFRIGYHKSIIFDDMSFLNVAPHHQIHLLDFDNPRQLWGRYRNARIPARTQKIFLSNGPIFSDFLPEIARRLIKVNLFNTIE